MGKKDQKVAKQALEVQRTSVRIAKYALALAGVMAVIALIAVFKPQTVEVTIDPRSVLDSISANIDSVQLATVPAGFDTVQTMIRDSLEAGGTVGIWDLLRLGNVLFLKAKIDLAENYYSVALDQAVRAADSAAISAALNSMGIVAHAKGDHRQALTFYSDAIAIDSLHGWEDYIASTLCNMGNAYHGLDMVDEAMECHERALAIYRDVGDRQAEGHQLGNIGNVHACNGEPMEALRYYRDAYAIGLEFCDSQSLVKSSACISHMALLVGDLDFAMRLGVQSLAISEGIGDRDGETSALVMIARIYLTQGDTTTAIAQLHRARQILREIDLPSKLVAVEEIIGEVNGGKQMEPETDTP